MTTNEQEKQFWSSAAGKKWIEHEQALDTAMQGMLDAVLGAAAIEPNGQVLDIGCGTGASTIQIAQALDSGQVLGADISAPLLDRAQARASALNLDNIAFRVADAQVDDFDGQRFDVLVSRLGMMFFADPVVAFKNLSAALRPGGRMAFICWTRISDNPWFQIPKQAAEQQLGSLPPPSEPNAPGPTAFRDRGRVSDLVTKAGLIDVQAKKVEIALTPPGGLSGAAFAASSIGPASRIMKAFNGTGDDAKAIEAQVRQNFEQFQVDGQVFVPAQLNLFTCRTPS